MGTDRGKAGPRGRADRGERRFRRLLDTLPSPAYTCDPEGLITYFNRHAVAVWGREPKLNHPDDRFCGSFRLRQPDGTVITHDQCWMALALKGGRAFNGEEIVIERADGQRTHALVHASPIHDDGGRLVGAVNVLVDIEETTRADEERRRLEVAHQEEKFRSLSVLAGGIAHDFNSLLTSMLGYAALAKSELGAGSRAAPMLTEIEKAATSAADLARQMLAYSGRGRFEVGTVALDDLVRRLVSVLEPLLSVRAMLECDLAPASAEGDPVQLQQVVMNLVTNASDALGDDPGTIRVTTGEVDADRAMLRSPFVSAELPPGRYAFVEVADTGAGIAPADLRRIFDPFFTTKRPGRGLGLASALGTVRFHKGAVRVASEVGKGTTFTVLVPGAPAAAAGTAVPDAATPRGTGTVLVIDDETGVRTFVRDALERAGFRVHEAGDGRAAIATFRRLGDEIDAVVLDLTMPGMKGADVLRALRAARPDVPVLVMSGYSDTDVPDASDFLPKPFRPADLVARLTAILPR